jgi:hypothetical protein
VESARFLKKSRPAPGKINAGSSAQTFRFAFFRLAVPQKFRKNYMSGKSRSAGMSFDLQPHLKGELIGHRKSVRGAVRDDGYSFPLS